MQTQAPEYKESSHNTIVLVCMHWERDARTEVFKIRGDDICSAAFNDLIENLEFYDFADPFNDEDMPWLETDESQLLRRILCDIVTGSQNVAQRGIHVRVLPGEVCVVLNLVSSRIRT